MDILLYKNIWLKDFDFRKEQNFTFSMVYISNVFQCKKTNSRLHTACQYFNLRKLSGKISILWRVYAIFLGEISNRLFVYFFPALRQKGIIGYSLPSLVKLFSFDSLQLKRSLEMFIERSLWFAYFYEIKFAKISDKSIRLLLHAIIDPRIEFKAMPQPETHKLHQFCCRPDAAW